MKNSAKSLEAYVKQLDAAHVFDKPIVTQIAPLDAFYRGEEYHQDYAMKNPHNPYIQVCDIPKIAALGRAVSRALPGVPAIARCLCRKRWRVSDHPLWRGERLS